MNLQIVILSQTLLLGYCVSAGEIVSANAVSPAEERAAVAPIIEDLRRSGVLADMRRYGLLTNSDSEITWAQLWPAMCRFKSEHFPLVSEPAAWEQIPRPDLKGTNDPGGVQAFVQTNGWNMGQGVAGAAWGLVETKRIKGLPWSEIKHREFQAVTANGILYLILDGFNHSMYGVAYNPGTNRFDLHLVGFSPIGDRWYAWRQPEDPMTLPQQYEGGVKPAGQPVGPANGSEPNRSETNRTSSAAGSRR